MKPPLTPQEKENNKLRKNLSYICNNISAARAFGNLPNWEDLYVHLGYKDEDIKKADKKGPISKEELKAFLDKMKADLESKILTSLSGTALRPVSNQITETTKEKETTNETNQPKGEQKVQETSPKQSLQQNDPNKGGSTKTTTEDESRSDSKFSTSNNYGLTPSPNEKVFFYWFQKKAVAELFQKTVVERKSGVLLLAGTGTGKTFIIGGLHRRLLDIQYENNKTFSHIPYLYITRTTVVEQATRVFKDFFHSINTQDIEIINIEQVRSKVGRLWIKENIRVFDGEEEIEYIWKNGVQPCVIYFDESQAAKNSTSTQHKIMCAYNNLKANAQLVNISATPFTRVSEAKCFAVSTHRPLEHLGFPAGTVLTNETWPMYASIMAGDGDPTDYNEAAVERLIKDLEPWIVRVRGVRPQFDAVNNVEKIDFSSQEERKFYLDAWTRFQEEMAKLEKDVDGANYRFVILLKFSMAAELCRVRILAKRMYESVSTGKAAVCACKFKGTIIEVVKILVNDYNVSRDNISLIWGGGQTQLTKKQKAKKKIKDLADVLEKSGMSSEELLEMTELDEVEDRELQNLDPALRLGPQDMSERQKEIDKFQKGKSLYSLFTFRAGGVGLSLHHTDELLDIKCRRKESGYAVEEDIPNIPVRPRRVFLAPTYSAIELVQGLGRCPRLTSLSTTVQTLLFYRGTIEEDIADIVSQKLRCLSKVVKMRESWQDVVVGGVSKEEALSTTKDVPDDEEGTITTDEGEE